MNIYQLGDLLGSGFELGEVARGLAAAGWPVFACVPGGKTPLTGHGFHDATSDVNQVSAWWARWPQANIGLPTGAVSGVEVVDVDVRSSGDGRPNFARVAGACGSGWALQVVTASGGWHLYYPADPTRQQRCWADGNAHVDFRGDGGYVIVPPSVVDTPTQRQVRYRLAMVCDQSGPVDASRLRRLLDPQRAGRPSGEPTAGGLVSRGDTARLAKWVAARPVGERNQGLFWAACRLVEAGHDQNGALAALRTAARQAGLADKEIQVTIGSAYRAAGPRSTPAPTINMGSAIQPACEAVSL